MSKSTNASQYQPLNPSKIRLFAFNFLLVLSLLLANLTLVSSANGQTQASSALAQPIALSEFFKRSQFRDFSPSPDGRFIATTASLNGRLNLVVIDLETRTALPITNWDNIDVGNLQWVGNQRILYQAVRVNEPTGQETPRQGGLFVVSRDGKESRQLAKTFLQLRKGGSIGLLRLQYLAQANGYPDEILGLGAVINDSSNDVYRVNLITGKDRLLTQGRPSDRVDSWILDNKQVPRVAIARGEGASTEYISYYRSSADGDWKMLRRFDTTKSPAFVPLAFEADDKTLLVAANDGRDNMAIYRFDPEENKFVELVAQHPKYDMGAAPDGRRVGGLLFDPKTKQLRGLRVDADKPTAVWLDEKIAKVQDAIDAALPSMFNALTLSESGKYFVTSFSDTNPGRYYQFNPEKGSLELLGSAAPWLDNQLAKVIAFKLKTRDGLEIPSYYVLPKDYKAGTKLPTIVHIHGGPMARDLAQGGRFGFSFGATEAQILASRGYAVILPNFRITPQLGSKIYYAGFGTYGKEMLDDHEDAVKWAIEQGFSDPKKICISGASYGGYAALQVLTRPSNPFVCAISGLPVTDLKYQRNNADYSRSLSAVEYWRKVQGVSSFDDPSVRELSPLYNAEKIKVPVFMYVGQEDLRAPIAQAEKMRDAMVTAGNPLKEYYVGKAEGHGFGVSATNVELYEKILNFLELTLK